MNSRAFHNIAVAAAVAVFGGASHVDYGAHRVLKSIGYGAKRRRISGLPAAAPGYSEF